MARKDTFASFAEVFKAPPELARAASRAVLAGRLRRIRGGLYTTNLADPLESVVRKNLWRIVALLCPDCIVSHRSALDSRPTPGGTVFVTGSYNRTISDLPGLTIRQLEGPGPLPGDRPFMSGLAIASRARSMLECLSGRPRGAEGAYLSESEMQERLARLLRGGLDLLNQVRDEARELAPLMNAESAFAVLDELAARLVGTQEARQAQAVTTGAPYDANRLALFQTLFQNLAEWPAVPRPDPQLAGPAFDHISFFDAYFSNYIEGTEFTVEQAEGIVFQGVIAEDRPSDSHDVSGTYEIVGSATRMSKRISELETSAFLEEIRAWHKVLMGGRPEINPGAYKLLPNRAGGTLFVEPALVEGTLREGFEMGRGLGSAFGRAAFLMFLIAEVHPFADGNGRIARAVANAELVSHGERRLIIPTVYRIEYLDALRLLSQDGDPRNLARMLDRAQEFSASIDFHDLNAARAQLTAWNAFEQGLDAHLRRPRP